MRTPGIEAIVVGASAGAVDTLSAILPALPRDYRLPVLVVVHRPANRESALTEVLGAKCQLPVREAEDKEEICPGTVYLAPADYHLLVEKERILSLSSEEPVLYSRPSINILFETAADAYGPSLVGVILSGANQDGAAGLKCIVEAGGIGLVQRPDLAYSPAMPQAALDLCPDACAMSLEQIAAHLQEIGTAS